MSTVLHHFRSGAVPEVRGSGSRLTWTRSLMLVEHRLLDADLGRIGERLLVSYGGERCHYCHEKDSLVHRKWKVVHRFSTLVLTNQ